MDQSLTDIAHEHYRAGRYDQAIAEYRRVLQLIPTDASAHYNFGVILAAAQRFPEAIAAYSTAIQLDPNHFAAHTNLAAALLSLGRVTDSIASARRALQINPDVPEALTMLANGLFATGEITPAVELYQRAVALRPDYAPALNNLGGCLPEIGQIDQAIAACRAALALQPNEVGALSNLALALQSLAQHDQAIAAFDQALALDPKNSALISNRLLALHFLPGLTPQYIFEEHRRSAPDSVSPSLDERNAHRRLSVSSPKRIAYLSPDLWGHSVSFFLLSFLPDHDRSQFHVTCYHTSAIQDGYTDQIRSACDRWVADPALTADQIRADQIDILVDLSGHTAHNRLPLFAQKPAPLQLTYLGYPDTTGLSAIDFRITDWLADPAGADQFYTEKLIRLPQTAWCFHPLSGSPPIQPSSRSNIVFGCFNNSAKFNAPLISLWARVLQAVPDSQLLLKNRAAHSTAMQDWLRQIFNSHGVSPSRIQLMPRLPASEGHLRAYDQIDIALDTFPYNGTTTTCESLWMGVPVITLAGNIHASRVGSSLLTSVGLPYLIAHSESDYIRIAAQLAAERPRLAGLRSALRPQMLSSPLMDAPTFARNLESAYRHCWSQLFHPAANNSTP